MKAIEANYRMSNSDLMMLASNIVGFMNRDSVEFAVRGVTATDITDFQALGNAFEVFPSDEEYVGLIAIEVNAKNELRNSLMIQVRSIEGFMNQKFGINSGEFKRLGVKGLISKSDGEFLYRTRGVYRIATEYFTILSAIGLTQAALDTLDADAQLFEDKLNSVNSAKAIRDGKTQDRNMKGNELFMEVQKFSRIGKAIWQNIDETKFNDYIIYHTTQSSLGKVLNLAGVYVPAGGGEMATIDLSWSTVTGANGYDVERSIVPLGNPAAGFALIGSSANTNFQDTNIATIPSSYYYRVRALDATTTGAYSGVLLVQVTS